MVVVADASPLIFLSRLGLLRLLPRLYDRILVPEQVFSEAAGEDEAPGSIAIREADWIRVVAPSGNEVLQAAVREELDAGEAAAIGLALERSADLLLIDERQGRRVARRLGLTVKGTIGLLVTARREGLLEELRPVLDRLLSEGAWITEDLLRAALKAAGEGTDDAG